MYACMHECMYTHPWVCTHTHIYICMGVCLCLARHVWINLCISTFIYTDFHEYMWINVHMYVYKQTSMSICLPLSVSVMHESLCIFVCMHGATHTRVYACGVCMYILYWALDIGLLLNAEHYERRFTFVFLARPLLCTVSFLVEGEPPPPRSTPWGAYRSAVSCEAVPLRLAFLWQHSYSLTVDRSMVVGHVPTDHMCSFMCTNHIEMTVHNLAFLQVR